MFGRKKTDSAKKADNSGRLNRRFAIAFSFIVIVGFIYLAATEHGTTLLQFRFNPFALLSATTVIINTLLLIYFLRKPARTDERIWLTVYMVGLIMYAIGELFWRLSANTQAAVFWTNLSDVGVLIPGGLYLFVLAYTNRSERRYAGLTAFILLATVVYIHFVGTTDLIYDPNPAHWVGGYAWGIDAGDNTTGGQGLLLGLVWFFGLPFLAWFRLLSFRRHTRNPILRRQTLIFIWASAIPIVIGIFTDILIPSVGIKMPAFGITMFTPGAILIVYGLIRYQLLTVSPTLFSNTILSIMQEAVVVTDKSFNIVYLNPKAEAMLGVKAEASDSVSLLRSITENTVEPFKTAFAPENMQQGNETIDVEHIDIETSHNTKVPVRVTGSRLAMTDLDMWVVALSDITKELQTRSVIEHEVTVRTEELHQARAYLISSINSLEQGFILVNDKGNTELINGVAAHLFGVSTADANTSRSLADMIKTMSWDWDINLPDVVGKVLSSKRHRQQEVSATNGSSYQLFVTPVLSGEHVLGATVVVQDVTEQRILDRSKDEFFSIASHELRTPLTAIRGNMSMVREYFPDAMKDDSLANMVTDTHDASVRLIAIVNDFLDSSKLEQGKMQFDLKPVSLPAILEAVQKDLSVLIDKQHDKLVLEGLHKLPKVITDEGRVRQIIYNLLSNAIKYCENGTITVSGEATDHNLTLRFTDTGKGISPEGQKLLFHKFQQAGDSTLTRDDTKGTGLGLYISRLLANNMHGEVALELSEVGKGSSFTLTLPVAK